MGRLSSHGDPDVKRLTACAVAAAFACVAIAADAPKTPTFDPHFLSRQVRVLSSDAFEGRGPATAVETLTVEYVIGHMKADGLQPAGALEHGKRSWARNVYEVMFLDENGYW